MLEEARNLKAVPGNETILKAEIASKPQTDGDEVIIMLDDFYDIFESMSAKLFKDLEQ